MLHPFLVHFPLALTLSAWLLSMAAALSRERMAGLLASAATVNLCLAAGLALLALGTGLAAVLDLTVDAPAHQAIARHAKWALFSSCALILLAVWRGAGVAPATKPSAVFLAMLSGVAAALLTTAWLGHRNVFMFGVGVSH